MEETIMSNDVFKQKGINKGKQFNLRDKLVTARSCNRHMWCACVCACECVRVCVIPWWDIHVHTHTYTRTSMLIVLEISTIISLIFSREINAVYFTLKYIYLHITSMMRTHVSLQMHTHMCTQTYTHTHTHTRPHAYSYTLLHTYTYEHTHTCTYAYAHICSRTKRERDIFSHENPYGLVVLRWSDMKGTNTIACYLRQWTY